MKTTDELKLFFLIKKKAIVSIFVVFENTFIGCLYTLSKGLKLLKPSFTLIVYDLSKF